jgi:hypothetical protein
MSSSRRLALLLALSFAAVTAGVAQSPASSSNPAPDQAQAAQTAGEAQGQLSVQARIRARRAQRRAAAIHDSYAHLYDAYFGMGYLRFVPGPGYPASGNVPHGPGLVRAHEYSWNVGLTRYYSERMGVTVDGRGYSGTAWVGLQPDNTNNYVQGITNPAISQYAVLVGPTYRFYLQPKYSISGRVMGGFTQGNFSGDTNHDTKLSTGLGLWPDGDTFAASASIPVEYNLTPRVGLRVAPEFYLTGFGSTEQKSLGFTIGMVYRFGKQ